MSAGVGGDRRGRGRGHMFELDVLPGLVEVSVFPSLPGEDLVQPVSSLSSDISKLLPCFDPRLFG